jgi:uncharacterized protein YkwD
MTLVLLCLVAWHVCGAEDFEPKAAEAREMFRLLNEARASERLPPLAWDDRLARAAFDHAKVCVEHKELSHQFSGEPSLNLRLARSGLR